MHRAVTHPRHAALLSLLLAACGSPRLPIAQDDESSSTTSSETSTTGPSNTFVPDYGGPLSECDVFAHDCPDGEKCVPYSSTGADWDAHKCVPVTGDQAHGEPCTYAGTAEATDDCDENSGCYDVHEVDGELIGTCHAFCMGTADDPECPPSTSCLISSSGSLGYCVFACDPVAQDCGARLGCYWTGGEFSCTFTSENIPVGEPCGFINDCAPGLLCANTDVLPACNGSACCAIFCSLSVGDSQCAAVPGTACVPFYYDGFAPPGYEDTGVCIVPMP
jgi:hypothetical protein